jgi:hypothetical protein
VGQQRRTAASSAYFFLACSSWRSVVLFSSRSSVASSVAPTVGAAAADGAEDVHIVQMVAAHNTVKAARTMIGIENKFMENHTKVMNRLNKVLRKVTAHVGQNNAVELVETASKGIVLPTLDDTGSHAHLPRANLTRFRVKPTIDTSLIQDAKLTPKAPAAAAAASASAVVVSTPRPAVSLLEEAVEGIVLPVLDDTGSHGGHLPKANLTRFTVKPTIDATLVQDAKLVSKSKVIDSVPKPAVALLEEAVEGVVLPVVDDTGSHAHLPKANLTRFTVKPTIDATLVHDMQLHKKSAPVVGAK